MGAGALPEQAWRRRGFGQFFDRQLQVHLEPSQIPHTSYYGGETVEFFFTINQKQMLCREANGYFYEFVPGRFNATPVHAYEFRWNAEGSMEADGVEEHDGYYTWRGNLECREYKTMRVHYDKYTFVNCPTVAYEPFDDSGTCNELEDEKVGFCVLMVLLILFLAAVEVYIIDCHVFYYRGRDFMTGYGYHIHTYGRSNPW